MTVGFNFFIYFGSALSSSDFQVAPGLLSILAKLRTFCGTLSAALWLLMNPSRVSDNLSKLNPNVSSNNSVYSGCVTIHLSKTFLKNTVRASCQLMDVASCVMAYCIRTCAERVLEGFFRNFFDEVAVVSSTLMGLLAKLP